MTALIPDFYFLNGESICDFAANPYTHTIIQVRLYEAVEYLHAGLAWRILSSFVHYPKVTGHFCLYGRYMVRPGHIIMNYYSQ